MPKCIRWEGERIIAGILENNKIANAEVAESRMCIGCYFHDQRYNFTTREGTIRVLRPDFYVVLKNGICLFLEFDGIQHFKFPNYWHKTKEDFDKLQENDKIKDKYWQDNNLPYLRVSYKQKEMGIAQSKIEEFIKPFIQDLLPNGGLMNIERYMIDFSLPENAEHVRKKAEKEAEKERKRVEREAEREAKRARVSEEMERKRAEKERKRVEREAEREAKRARISEEMERKRAERAAYWEERERKRAERERKKVARFSELLEWDREWERKKVEKVAEWERKRVEREAEKERKRVERWRKKGEKIAEAEREWERKEACLYGVSTSNSSAMMNAAAAAYFHAAYPYGVSSSNSSTMMNAAAVAYNENLKLATVNFHAALSATASTPSVLPPYFSFPHSFN